MVDAGSIRVGIDHFAVRHESLAGARHEDRLSAIFRATLMIARIDLGASAIERIQQGLDGNAISANDCLARIAGDRLTAGKGCLLRQEDRFRAEITIDSCASWQSISWRHSVVTLWIEVRHRRSFSNRQPYHGWRRGD
ncbi:hypothetical protein [Bradyrhizobium niftali]|uniref:Uncharacterized protein n=1 Tax=Bradyrhizobium niftali TaxID=2560055 RepID=A0A4Y9LFH0_9BRAD|nr:hypothetical protein [Bradyrhizobium niftali]TFV42211.1 hypothetical protein E4K65_34835 [Bradyrhizobium niftali]